MLTLLLQAAPVVDAMVRDEDSAIEKIAKLGKLKDAGVLTEEEFAAKKEQLLRDI